MPEANREKLSKKSADLVDLLHERLTEESLFNHFAIDYDADVAVRPWYASLLSEVALLIGEEDLEYVRVSVKADDEAHGTYSLVVLTSTTVITAAGDVTKPAPLPDHGQVIARSRSGLKSLQVLSALSDPFSEKKWPRPVTLVAEYAGEAKAVVLGTDGENAAKLIDSLKADLHRG